MTSHYLASQQAYQHKVITTLEFTKKAQRAQKHSKDVIASVKITSKSKVWNLDDFCTLTADPAAMSDSPRYNDGNHVKLKPSCAVVSTKKRLPSQRTSASLKATATQCWIPENQRSESCQCWRRMEVHGLSWPFPENPSEWRAERPSQSPAFSK